MGQTVKLFMCHVIIDHRSMYGTIHKNQLISDTHPTLAKGFKFVGVPGIKELGPSNTKNDSGIQNGSHGQGDSPGHHGGAPGNDGVGTPVHD